MASNILDELNVSRETVERLQDYVALLKKWNKRINLVARRSANEVWQRHIEDSAQILKYAPLPVERWLDLGSGGGLPGLVVAIIGAASGQIQQVTLVESDARKAVFLGEVSRILGLNTVILNERIESIPAQNANVISARALADLPALFDLSIRHATAGATYIFPKGATHRDEIRRAMESWTFDVIVHPSVTEPDAAILVVRNLARKEKG